MALTIWQEFAQDSLGNAINSPVVTVRKDAVIADIFSDIAGLVPKANPFVGDTKGYMFFYAEAGLYEIEVQTPAGTTVLPNVPIGTGQNHDVGDDPDDLVTNADLPSADAFIESLSVTVGTGGDYETWDEMYEALSVKRIGTLAISAVGDIAHTGVPYAFLNADRLAIDLGSVSVTGPDSFIIQSNVAGQFVFSGTTDTNFVLFNFLLDIENASTGNGTIDLYDCAGSATFTDETIARIYGTFSGAGYLDIVTLGYVNIEGVTSTNISARAIYPLTGSHRIKDIVNTSTVAIGEFIDVQAGALLDIPENATIDAGTNGVTTLINLGNGLIIDRCTSITGTYTSRYSQSPGIPTDNGEIFAAGASKANLSTIASQGLSDAERAYAQANLKGRYTWSAKPAANSMATGSRIIITDVSDVDVEFYTNGTRWLAVGGSFVAKVINTDVTSSGTSQTVAGIYTVKSGLLGPNGGITIHSVCSCTGSVNAKNVRTYFGSVGSGSGGTLMSINATGASATTIAIAIGRNIFNRNSVSSQISEAQSVTGFGVSTTAPSTSTINTDSADSDCTVTVEATNGADSIVSKSLRFVITTLP